MPNFNDLFPMLPTPPVPEEEPETPDSPYSDEELLTLHKEYKKLAMEDRWLFEKQWTRNIFYALNRHWIEYHSRDGQWRDKRMAKWIPRPVNPDIHDGIQAIRAMLTSVKLGVNVRPNGAMPEAVAAAATADELHPLLHDDHAMNTVLTEADWWLIVTGNFFLHTFMDYDPRYGVVTVTAEQCMACQTITPSDKLVGPSPTCPACGMAGEQNFQQATNPMTGEPIQTKIPKGKAVTLPLSALEVAFPNHYPRFAEVPFVYRLRWRTKSYFENHPILKDLVPKLSFQKSPADRNLQIFRSMASMNDLGAASTSWAQGTGGGESEEGLTEYELWVKPTEKYPEGLCFRVVGESDPVVLHLEETEAIPGPLPYQDSEGNPLFTFTHAGYEPVGGRILASGALDPAIQKIDQLNQLDSMLQMIVQRMANPVWLEPKGAEVEKFTGEPGLVVKWNPLTVQGNAKPERIAGEGPHGSLFQLRQMYKDDIASAMGTFDVLKGQRPPNVESFSGMQLLVERSQSRFANVFQSRADAYRDWFRFAIELERAYGPDERTKAILGPTHGWTFKTFKTAQLQGAITIIVEDGSTTPKTNLGIRAAVQHASSLNMLDMNDPDQKYEGLKLFGLTKMVPSLDVHVQAALQKQQEFEEWVQNPQAIAQGMQAVQAQDQTYQQQAAAAGMDPMTGQSLAGPPPSPLAVTPLKWRKWYNPIIHRQEFLKWANSDRMREVIRQVAQAEGLMEAHLAEIDLAMMEAAAQAGPPQEGRPQEGAARSMTNSNTESTTTDNEPSGSGEEKQGQGPA